MTASATAGERVVAVSRAELEALREQSIREIVAAAPPLTGELRETVRAILNPPPRPATSPRHDEGAARPAAPVVPARRPDRRVADPSST